MYRQCLSVVAGLLAAAAFALSPGTAAAQHHGGGGHGGHGGGGWHGGGGGGWHGGGGGGWHGGGGGGHYHGGGGWHHDGYGHHQGWGVGIGLGYPYYGYGWGGYSPGYYSSSPYYYGDSGYDNTYPYYADSSTYRAPAYSDLTTPDYSYGAATQPAADNQARVRVVVPPDAKVWFDDKPTQQSGSVRDFETPPLTPGREFSYDVKAQWRDQDGKEVTRTKHVDVTANSRATVDFTPPAK